MFNFVSRFPLRDPDPGAAGGGAGTVPGFDPVAYKAELFGEMNKTLNGFAKSFKTDIAKLLKPADGSPAADPSIQQDPPTDPASPPAGTPPKVDAQTNGELAKLRRDMEALRKQTETLTASNAEKENALRESARLSAVRSAVDEISFRDAASKALFLRSILSDVVYDEDGQIVVKTDAGALPVAEYVKTEATRVPNLLAPIGSGGSGAKGGGTPGAVHGSVSLKSLTPEAIAKWTPAEHAANMAKVIAGQVTD